MRRPWTALRPVVSPSLVAALTLLGAPLGPFAAHAAGPVDEDVATYRIRFDPGSTRLVVSATVPKADSTLDMDDTRPVGTPELDSLGWAGLVRDLRITDAAGNTYAAVPHRRRGWKLTRPANATLHLEYEVDYAPFQRLDWPAPREAAYRDTDHFALVGRSLFITTRSTRASRVTFELPAGWHASAPWRPEGGVETYVAGPPDELTQNFVVLSRAPRDEVVVNGFHLHIVALGQWARFRPQIHRVLEPVVRHHVGMMGSVGQRDYVMIFLPQIDKGAESYRSSFALCLDSLPSPASTPTWGNLVAHEMFHLWNGWTLKGADYMGTQWFQEGFTEYTANTAIVRSGLVDADWFRAKLARHIGNARRLTTTLVEIGTHKGPPLYSAGTLVAFTCDVKIREATNGRHDLGDFFRALMRQTDGGKRKYGWEDLRAALDATAPYDWEGFYQSHIRGDERLTIEGSLDLVGQRMVEEPEGRIRVEADPDASAAAKRRWADLVRSRR